jgi:hypothetical protein
MESIAYWRVVPNTCALAACNILCVVSKRVFMHVFWLGLFIIFGGWEWDVIFTLVQLRIDYRILRKQNHLKVKLNVISQKAWTGPRGSGSVKAPDFLDVRHYIRTGRLYPRRNPWYSFNRGHMVPSGPRKKNPQRHHRESIPGPSG